MDTELDGINMTDGSWDSSHRFAWRQLEKAGKDHIDWWEAVEIVKCDKKKCMSGMAWLYKRKKKRRKVNEGMLCSVWVITSIYFMVHSIQTIQKFVGWMWKEISIGSML